MVLKPGKVGTNGHANRKLGSWIEAFIAFTDNLESAPVYRQWTAITIIAAALEQKVWITTSDRLYPNLYTILVGHPGVGKTRSIMAGRKFLQELPGFNIAPTSMKMASLVDALVAAKRTIVSNTGPATEFHSMAILVDEWTAFMHAFEEELVGGLTTFYDVTVPYEQHRRGKDIRIKIVRPQLSLLAGSTPSNLIKFIPDFAWDQGFTSRIILVFSDDRFVGDDFRVIRRDPPPEMIHDLNVIYSLSGEFEVEEGFRQAVNEWRAGEEKPKPTHPKLIHYATRRRAHLYKLAMVASVDRGSSLRLTVEDFNTALTWMLKAETVMPGIFEAGTSSVDARAMEEIVDAVRRYGKPVPHHRLIHETARRVPAHAVLKIVEIMWLSGKLKKTEDNFYLPTD